METQPVNVLQKSLTTKHYLVGAAIILIFIAIILIALTEKSKWLLFSGLILGAIAGGILYWFRCPPSV